ncbi:4-aminobutyrate transaminase [Tremella mesenterica]|uniref:4-aminobutyrate transaminase n=1 Tax=Tremella mesenterica TaxID=5217 RepID=A0A4Q1BKR7_TREME|nr:uncharacterized protein TREMEDRAFT_61078 [Tremella mesenterica DSM 1558]EIW70573.1 hypothetical protein TREMEDRAFT_61078 [Tremella mesenterica DSM 1558]RXK38260.1 4-aminobutyrate transaminase [Tremella mesenterica]
MPGKIHTEAEWAEFGKEHVTHGLGRLRDHVMVKGRGAELWTSEEKRFLDFTSGIGVVNLGHCHPAITAAVTQQADSLVHMQCSIAFSAPYLQLIEHLLPVMPHPSLDSFFFWNSGSEAVEAAVKVARKYTGRQNIITMQGSYHGRTYGSAALTKSKTIYSQNTGPMMSGVITTPFPYWHSLGVSPSTSEEELCRMAFHQLDLVLKQQTAPSDTAAIIIEPVQGEGGYVPCPPKFLHYLREVCDKHSILLIIDEVQTGFYRTGKYFAIQHSGVRPDLMIFAKGIANGFPISGIVGSKKVMNCMPVGSMGGTYAGNPVCCAAGVAAQEVYKTGHIAENVAERSAEMRSVLESLAKSSKTSHLIIDTRILGLMGAIEFRSPSSPLTMEGISQNQNVPKDIGKRVQKCCLDKGMLILTTSCFDTIRFIPPLIISEKEMEEGMSIFRDAVETVAKEG